APVGETNLRLWDARTGDLKHTVLSGVQVDAVALSRSGKYLVTGAWGKDVTALWDLSDLKNGPKQVHEFAGCHDVVPVAFARDDKTFATVTSSGEVFAYDAASRKQLWQKQAHDGVARCVAYSADGKLLATAGNDKTVQLRDARTGDLKHTLNG